MNSDEKQHQVEQHASDHKCTTLNYYYVLRTTIAQQYATEGTVTYRYQQVTRPYTHTSSDDETYNLF